MKTILTIFAACFALAAFADRSATSLAGDWHYIVDPQNIGSLGYHDAPDSQRSFAPLKRASSHFHRTQRFFPGIQGRLSSQTSLRDDSDYISVDLRNSSRRRSASVSSLGLL